MLAFLPAAPAHGAIGINSSVYFQGRQLNAAGAVGADGQYNMQFKLYQDGTGTVVANPGGALMWTESWVYGATTPDNRVTMKNGYFSIPLGSICSFSATTCTAGMGNNAQVNTAVDFNQDTLWLSTNPDTRATSIDAAGGDGEMIPMRRPRLERLWAECGEAVGLSSARFIQNASAAQQTANFNVLSGAAPTAAAAHIQTVASATAPGLILKDGVTSGTGGDLLHPYAKSE